MFLYIHIPFCESKCKYCHFASTWKLQKFQIQKYVDFITFDTSNYRKQHQNSLKSIYFWWGTPWVLSLEQLKKILTNYNYSSKTETTLESTPNKITKDSLIAWKKLWINRLSIWVQSLNNKTLKEIGREDKWDILTALDNIKEIWFSNISIDFIIGLPHVQKWWVLKDIEYILDKYDFITHISVYMLEDYYYPWNWEENSITEDDYLWEYIEVKKYLEKKWFNRYEVSNFSKKWYECKHNMAYWNHSEIKAIWLSASWYEKWERYTFSDKFSDFYNKKGIFREQLNKSDIFMEKVMFGLRTSWLLENIYIKLNREKVKYFIKQEYLFIENKKLKLTNKWILVLDYILREII